MKIVLLVYCLTGGGAERVAALWARGFAERGYQVTVVVFNDLLPVSYVLPRNVQLRSVVSHQKYGVLRVLERIRKLRRLLRQENPEVVIDVNPAFDRIMSRMGLRCFNISTEHNSFERPDDAQYKWDGFTKFYINRLYDHVTVLTLADKNVIGNRLKHVSVLPNPLALEPVKTVPPKEKTVLAVGRKDVWHCKGFDVLMKAWSQVATDTDGWRLQIIGGSSGEGQAYLENLRHEYGLTDSVDFLDYQSDIRPYYQRAGIFVLSSRYEGFGLVLIEAMSQGCACIACDYKGRQSEIISNGLDGVTCEPDNVDALVKALCILIADDERRVQLQKNAISRAADFSLEKNMDCWDELFIERKLL